MTDSYGLISLFPILICINTIWQISQNWSQFWDAQVTESDRQLAQQSAIFILIPLGVLLHEIGHSLATWQVGGTVTTFRWLFFSGYIIPSGNFSTVEYWWIVFAGNLLSICLGLIPILLIPRIRKRIIAEVLYWFACMQSIYALILYPLWSALSRSGDWVQIYNFAIAPYAKLVLVAHLALLWGLWRLYCSQKVVEWRLARSSDALATWHQLLLEGANRPNDLQPQMELGYFLLQHQEIREAKKIATKINRLKPNEPKVKLFKLVLKYHQRAYHQVIKLGQKLLNAELTRADKLRIYRILCLSSLSLNRSSQALEYANQGLTIAPNDYKLRCHRALIYETLKQYQKAIAELDLALDCAPDEDTRQWITQLRTQYAKRIYSNND